MTFRITLLREAATFQITVDTRPYRMIIHLTKVTMFRHTVFHEVKTHFFLGLAAADGRIFRRKSRFMLASNFRIGTR